MMERTCPVCGHWMSPHQIVCSACRQRIERREPVCRETVLYAWGRSLMFLLALFLFLKGAAATFSPEEYRAFAHALGFGTEEETFHYLNAAFVSAASLLYAVAWLGGYLKHRWETAVCFIGLAVFVVGQGITQFMVQHEVGGLARSLAFFMVWIAVPIFQFVALALGRRAEAPAPVAEAAASAGPEE